MTRVAVRGYAKRHFDKPSRKSDDGIEPSVSLRKLGIMQTEENHKEKVHSDSTRCQPFETGEGRRSRRVRRQGGKN
jgi:hypothetical protein